MSGSPFSLSKPLLLALIAVAGLMGLAVLAAIPLLSSNVYFLLFLPFACIFVLIMVMRTRLALVLLLMVRPLLNPVLEGTKVEALGSQTGIGGVLNLLIIGISILLILQNTSQVRKAFPFVKWWAFFLLVGLVSVSYAPERGLAFKAFSQLTSYMFIYLIPFFIIKDDKDKKFWIKVLFFSSLLPVGLACIAMPSSQFLHLSTLDAGSRLQGTFAHPNVLGFYLVWIFAVTFLMLKTESISLTKMQRTMLYLYLFILAAVLLATKTRSAWLACWMLFVLYGMLKEKKIFILSILLAILMLFTPQVRERMESMMNRGHTRVYTNVNSVAWRLQLWSGSLPLIRKNIVGGHGLASFRVLSPTFFNTDRGYAAHNVYLEILFETGVLGLGGFIAAFFTMLGRFFSRIKNGAGALSNESAIFFSYLVTYLIVCFSDNILMYIEYNWYFLFFLGLGARTLFLPMEQRRG